MTSSISSQTAPSFPTLNAMLHPLLLMEEGQHEFVGNDAHGQELRHFFFPITRRTVYLNHASTGPLPRPVAQIMHACIDDTSNFGGINADRWKEHQQGAHRRLARLINGRPDQIAMTASSGDGLMLIAQGLNWQAGDTVISAQGEFPANIYPWLNLQEMGVKVHLVPARNQRILPSDIFAQIDEHTRLVSLSLVEFSTGFRNDIATIAAYCHERGIICGIDAMQALGSLDLNVQTLGVDYAAAAAHKWLLSPHTTGVLYLADHLLANLQVRRRNWFSVANPFEFFNYQQPLKMGAARFEHSSPNAFPIVALDASLGLFEGLEGGMQAVEARILGLTSYAMIGLERLGFPVISPQGQGERSGIVCFMPHPEHLDLTAQEITHALEERQIYVAERNGIVRISPHFYNTLEEIDTLLNALETLITIKK